LGPQTTLFLVPRSEGEAVCFGPHTALCFPGERVHDEFMMLNS
jgi:hypothetical protein